MEPSALRHAKRAAWIFDDCVSVSHHIARIEIRHYAFASDNDVKELAVRELPPLDSDLCNETLVPKLSASPRGEVVAIAPSTNNHGGDAGEFFIWASDDAGLASWLILVPDASRIERRNMVRAEVDEINCSQRFEQWFDRAPKRA